MGRVVPRAMRRLRRGLDRLPAMPCRWSSSLVAAALFFGTGIAVADDLHALSVDTTAPGLVVVTVDGADPPTDAQRFTLKVGADEPIAAADVKAAAGAARATRLVVCIDKSGSMGNATTEAVKATLIDYFTKPRPGIDFALIGFGSATKTIAGFGTAPNVVAARIGEVAAESRDSKTKLFEAISGGIDLLRSGPDTAARRLLVISDGKDEGSDIGIERLVDKAHAANVVIDAIGIGRLAPASSSSLVSLSDRTGGTFVLDKASEARFSATFDGLVGKTLVAKPSTVVTFRYPVATDGARADHATLAYSAANATPTTQVLAGTFAMPVSKGTPPSPGPSPSPNPPWTARLEVLVNFKFPLVPILAVPVVAAFVLWLAMKLIKGSGNGSGAGAGRQPPPTVRQPTVPGPQPRPAARQTKVARYAFPPPRSGSPAAFLTGRGGPIGNRAVPIETELFAIGADPSSQLSLGGDDFVSGQHALIRFDSGSLYLSDRGSRNGTFLNGTRLAAVPMPLSLGDEVRVGRSVMIVDAGRGATAGAPRAEGSIA